MNQGRNFLNNRQNQSLINDVSDLVGGQKVNFDNVNNRLDGVNDMRHTSKNYQNIFKKRYHMEIILSMETQLEKIIIDL